MQCYQLYYNENWEEEINNMRHTNTEIINIEWPIKNTIIPIKTEKGETTLFCTFNLKIDITAKTSSPRSYFKLVQDRIERKNDNMIKYELETARLILRHKGENNYLKWGTSNQQKITKE